MRVVIRGLNRLDEATQAVVKDTVAMLKSKYPVDTPRQLTIRFCSHIERIRLWRQDSRVPDSFFDHGSSIAATISDSFRSDTIVECIGRAWKCFELVCNGTMDKSKATSRKVDRFGERIAKVIGREEATA